MCIVIIAVTIGFIIIWQKQTKYVHRGLNIYNVKEIWDSYSCVCVSKPLFSPWPKHYFSLCCWTFHSRSDNILGCCFCRYFQQMCKGTTIIYLCMCLKSVHFFALSVCWISPTGSHTEYKILKLCSQSSLVSHSKYNAPPEDSAYCSAASAGPEHHVWAVLFWNLCSSQ